MSHEGTGRPANRLAQETSAYLLQHAQHPVDWYPWGEEALRRARELRKPILLSIGYSACHWCHVMERESFEDERMAALMNEHFVCIKVDREERPDLDEIYMQATLALNQGQGGWPMTVFLTPEQEPIFAGTYFPPTDRWGRPGFSTVLHKVAEFWRTDPDGLRRQAANGTARLKDQLRIAAPLAVGEASYRRVATETLDYILREMTAPEGGFYSATDADSEGVEGKSFVWTPEEIRQVAPSEEDARRFCAYYDITPGGNWEHKSIPNIPRSLDDMARDLKVGPDELRRTLERLRPLVYDARRKRVPPGLDDKILTAWNGMMISAMAEGARVLGDSRYLEAAEQAADFLLMTMSRPDGGLYRTYRAFKAHVKACLEDYAFLVDGLIDLYEAGAHEGYLHEAVRLAERILADFADTEQGGFFTTARDHESLILRSREGPDGATPSGNAVAASALARLSFHYGREEFREAAAHAIRAYGRQIARHPRAFAKSLVVAELLMNGPVELALVGRPGEAGFEALRAEINRFYLPNRIIAHHDPEGPATRHPLLLGKGLVQGKAALYLCRNFTCQTPITDPAGVAAAFTRGDADGQTRAPADSAAHPRALQGTRLAGHATPGGTGAYAVRSVNTPASAGLAAHGYGMVGATGLTASRLGFGGYRIDADESEHRDALAKALREGCNLIDTSTNYTDGESERLIGAVLTELVRKGELKREEVIVVSKIGYVQGQNLKAAEARDKAGKPYSEVVKYGEGI